MARLPRLSLPGYAHHVIQLGHNRQPIVAGPADYQLLLDSLAENAQKFGVAIHAYVLMDNHFHLLVTPQARDSLSKMMQAVGRRYVRHFNDQQGRSGTLWAGRYKSTLIQSERYLLACMAYMDLNPVRAGLVVQARDYLWSSHIHYIGMRPQRLISPHPLYWNLGNTPFAREAAYEEMVSAGLSVELQQAIIQSTLHGWALGEADFVANLQKITERRVSKGRAGRPANSKSGARPQPG